MELLQEIAKYWPLIVGITVCYGWLWSLHWKITMNAKAIEELQAREAGLEKRFVDKFDTFYNKMSACMKDGNKDLDTKITETRSCLLYTSPSPRDRQKSRMPSSA